MAYSAMQRSAVPRSAQQSCTAPTGTSSAVPRRATPPNLGERRPRATLPQGQRGVTPRTDAKVFNVLIVQNFNQGNFLSYTLIYICI